MATDEEIQHALLAIHSRLGTIEGKINLVARADRDAVLEALRIAVGDFPLLGQIYLLIDGKRSQQEIMTELKSFGIGSSVATVSRRMRDLVTEYGIADEIREGASLMLRRNRAAEDILNLSRRVRKWLEDEKQVVPERPVRRTRTQKR